jgi:glycosyltransferase involved in cell wall biosynthesis
MRDTDPSPSLEQAFGPFSNIPKLRVVNPKEWEHHRGGWKYVCSLLKQLHADDGVRFISAVEDEIAEERPIEEPWVGFLHQVPKHTLRWFPDLERLLKHETWQRSLPYCQGLFVLSSVLSDYLRPRLSVPVARVFYPTEAATRLFDQRAFAAAEPRRLLFIGEYMRNFQDFYDLSAPGWSKELLVSERALAPQIRRNDSVRLRERVSDDAYDQLLSNSAVFLSLTGAPAKTTVIECIVRNTPILINRLPGVVEYLGEDYPLYYESLTEAEHKLTDPGLFAQAADYLERAEIKPKLTSDYFLNSIQNSAIYRQLPVPRGSAHGDARSFDLSVVICSYKRVYNMDRLLETFGAQDFPGTFEILIWNNNYEARAELDELYDKYRSRLQLHVIHSTENFYCVIRLAIASLIRSEVLLICDDDVIPLPGYISTFMRKHEEYGPRAVLCCRGNVFQPHVLNEEEPQRFWTDYEFLRFFDEAKEDRQVHFLHADNCLIPKAVMQEALQYKMERYEYWLIDDYWLSFVLSHFMQVPIWKIKADGALSFTPCADDPKIALYHNPRVAEQRINFYIHHMRQGWPFGLPSAVSAPEQLAAHTPLEDKLGWWAAGFHGANMYSEASRADFEAARRAGVRVVRLGAVGGAQDFRYLVNEEGTEAVLTEATLGRLEHSLRRAAGCGLKVILTLCHVPGRLFGLGRDQEDLRLLSSPELQDGFVAMWGRLAQFLRGFENVIGYDLLNEPYTAEDVGRDFLDEPAPSSGQFFNDLYARTIREIAQHDSETPIILESDYWGSPRTFAGLAPHSDPRIIYSFHFYFPRALTFRRANRGRFAYPGEVPRWPESSWSECRRWDRTALQEQLQAVKTWQEKHGVPDRNILVGEFGICRDTAGAKDYLTDLIELFREFGWNWTIFSFRDEEWDAMNYELGPRIENMLQPVENELFAAVAKSFQ